MALADDFERIVSALPGDWTDLQLDLRIADEARYIDAAVLLSAINAQPYSRSDWHWRIACARGFGHAAAAETVTGVLGRLDEAGIEAELVLREVREGRSEVTPMWGRTESVRQEFARRRAQ
jgi:hypothetical protein